MWKRIRIYNKKMKNNHVFLVLVHETRGKKNKESLITKPAYYDVKTDQIKQS